MYRWYYETTGSSRMAYPNISWPKDSPVRRQATREAFCRPKGQTPDHNCLPSENERTNRALKRNNSRQLRRYIVDHQLNWDEYVQPLIYADNTQTRYSTKITPFSLVLSRRPTTVSTVGHRSCFPIDVYCEILPRALCLHRLEMPPAWAASNANGLHE